MKKLWQNLSSLVGGGWAKLTNGQGPAPVVITAYAQPEKLRAKMEELGITHGQTLKIDLTNVHLMDQKGKPEKELRFCETEGVLIHEQITPGDGGELPKHVILPKGLTAPTNKQGYYIVTNLIFTSNGTMQIEETEETKWELVTAG